MLSRPLEPYTAYVILRIPKSSLVLLIGASGAGKSTFARRHFRATEVVSSDRCRALVSDDENDQSASHDAFEILRLIVARRLARKRLTVVDATNVQARARRELRRIAERYGVPLIAIVFDLPEEICLAHHTGRARRVPAGVIRKQLGDLKASLARLSQEGFAQIHRLESRAAVGAVKIRRIS